MKNRFKSLAPYNRKKNILKVESSKRQKKQTNNSMGTEGQLLIAFRKLSWKDKVQVLELAENLSI